MLSIIFINCSSNKLISFTEQSNLLSQEFTDSELNNLEISISEFLNRNNITNIKIKSKDRFISILAFLQDPSLIHKLSDEEKDRFFDIISSLFIGNREKIFILMSKLITNLVNKNIDYSILYVYCAIFAQLFSLIMQNNKNGYEEFFDYCVNSKIFDKLIDYIRDFDKLTEVKKEERELYEAILSIATMSVFPAENYYEILFKYKDKLIDENQNTCQKLGDLIETVAIIQIANRMSDFILKTINNKLSEYYNKYTASKDESISTYCRYLFFLKTKCEEYQKEYWND